MKLGLDVFLAEGCQRFKGNRIGLVTNMTGVNRELVPSIDLFHNHPDIHLSALYAPEHGIRGDIKEGEAFETSIDPHTRVPVFSLYGENRKPNREMMDAADVIVFDLQDIGSRYYTFIYTMAYMMEACAIYHKPFVVLDRPNPVNGVKMEGNLVEENVRSFVGLLPIPNRHGMTVGELALLFKHEYGYNCELKVIPMQGWKRHMHFDETEFLWVPPSPNTTHIDMAILYTGTCLIEGTNLSEGRGTTKPFEWIGAPYIDGHKLAETYNQLNLSGVLARPISFKPTYQKYKDEVCEGVQLHVVDRHQLNALEAGMRLLEVIHSLHPSEFEYIKNEQNKYFFDLLAGTKRLKTYITHRKTDEFLDECRYELDTFQKLKERYLLYK